MIRIPDAIMINDDVLFEAMRTLSPIGFKVYMYVYHSWFFYQEFGHGHASAIFRDLQYALQIDYEEVMNGFLEIKRKGYIDGLVVMDHTRKERIEFRWRVDDDEYTDRVAESFDIEKYMDGNYREQDALVIGLKIIRKHGEESKDGTQKNNGASKHWKAIREQALERDGYKCTECDEAESLHVHHLTYENEGNEKLEDLVTLCQSCHAKKKSVR